MRALIAVLAVLSLCASAEETATHTVTLAGGRITPSMIEVAANRRVKLVLRNDGPGPVEFESSTLRVEKVLAAGATSFVVIAPLRPGRYDFFDEFNPATGHMTLVVK